MGAVGVERSERQLGRFPGVHADAGFTFSVVDDQFAAGAGDWQRDGQRRDHAVRLFRIAMCGEETAGFVDEQLVEPCIDPLGRAAEPGRRLGPVNTYLSASKMSTKWMKPMNITSSFSNRENIRR